MFIAFNCIFFKLHVPYGQIQMMFLYLHQRMSLRYLLFSSSNVIQTFQLCQLKSIKARKSTEIVLDCHFYHAKPIVFLNILFINYCDIFNLSISTDQFYSSWSGIHIQCVFSVHNTSFYSYRILYLLYLDISIKVKSYTEVSKTSTSLTISAKIYIIGMVSTGTLLLRHLCFSVIKFIDCMSIVQLQEVIYVSCNLMIPTGNTEKDV